MELLRLATTAVAEATGLLGGTFSVGAAADFVLLDNGPRGQSFRDETLLEPLVLSASNFANFGSGESSNKPGLLSAWSFEAVESRSLWKKCAQKL